MRWARVPRVLVVAITAFVVGAPAGVYAQTPNECAQAYEQGQRQRIRHNLRASRAALEVCASPSCSANWRDDCATWLSDVKLALPSVVLEQTPAPAGASPPVTATIDGEPIQNPFSGLAIDADPGPHVLRFERPGVDPVTMNVTLREGEKGRAIVVNLSSPVQATLTASPSTSSVGPSARPILPLILAGGGVALAAAGSAFEIWGLSKRADVNACQPPSCPQTTYDSDKTSAQQTFLAGDILIGAGIAAVATGAIVYFLQRPGVRQPTVGAAPTPGGAMASFVARF